MIKTGDKVKMCDSLKDSLIKKKLIQVKEEKNEKGWKKMLVPTTIEISVTV